MAKESNRTTGISDYLKGLSQNAGSPTYRSHKVALKAYERWCSREGLAPEHPKHADIAAFLESRLVDCDNSLETAQGHLCSLSNYSAIDARADPRLTKVRIATHLNPSLSSPVRRLRHRVLGPFCADHSPNGSPAWAVDQLLSHLRRHQYGTRTHAIAATIADTRGGLHQVRSLDVGSLDTGNESVELPVSGDYFVADTIHPSWKVNLSTTTSDVLATYLSYERTNASVGETSPLFTTNHGRVSTSTIRRSIRAESKKALSYEDFRFESVGCSSKGIDSEEEQIVYPSDIRWAAIKREVQE
ncbi:hypothetical protein [Halovivax cerinus]|uniref:Core-binding (CB) domain-containing protein n=1 Tax=Halovivax cerinus TaxID=1487865 RepID=A0ABD5NQF6_9EURY|nr:hypothetical protein [Halovivax cerinus]